MKLGFPAGLKLPKWEQGGWWWWETEVLKLLGERARHIQPTAQTRQGWVPWVLSCASKNGPQSKISFYRMKQQPEHPKCRVKDDEWEKLCWRNNQEEKRSAITWLAWVSVPANRAGSLLRPLRHRPPLHRMGLSSCGALLEPRAVLQKHLQPKHLLLPEHIAPQAHWRCILK